MWRTKRYGYVDGWREEYAWATAYPVERKPQKPQPTAGEKFAKSLDHSRCLLRLAATRLKRAQTLQARWKRRVTYYEKKLAALNGGAHPDALVTPDRPGPPQ